MMTVGELKRWLQDNEVPDKAVIYFMPEMGTTIEGVDEVFATKSAADDPWGAIWEFEDYDEWYDEDRLREYARLKDITAICIQGDEL